VTVVVARSRSFLSGLDSGFAGRRLTIPPLCENSRAEVVGFAVASCLEQSRSDSKWPRYFQRTRSFGAEILCEVDV
jgi:hypothetical protein